MKLLIDGNAFLNVPTNVVMYKLEKDSKFDEPILRVDDKSFLKEGTKDYYRNFMLKYLTGIIAPLKFYIDEIIFVFDSKSWRKFYLKKKFDALPDVEGFVYKGNRKMDDKKKDLFLFFNYFTDEILPDLISNDGISTISVMGAEGDDLLAILCEELPNEDIAIWTVDQDMKQLVEYDNRFIIVTGPKSKKTEKKPVYVHNSIENNIVDLMNVDVDNKGLKGMVDFLERDREFDLIPVEPGDYILGQIMMGQRKDNIPSIYTKLGTTGKNINITEKKVEKILDKFDTDTFHKCFTHYIDTNNEDFFDNVVKGTLDLEKIKNTDEKYTDVYKTIRDNVELNSKLIRLKSNRLPERLVCMIKHKFSNLEREGKFNYGEYLKVAYPEG